MLVHFVTSLVDRFRAGRHSIRNCPPGSRVIEHWASFESAMMLPFSSTGFPAEAGQALQQHADPVGPLIGNPVQIRAVEDEFLVLGADPPRFGRLAAGFVILDELPLVGDRGSCNARRPDMRSPRLPDRPIAAGITASGGGANLRRSPGKTAKAARAAVSARNTRGRARPE